MSPRTLILIFCQIKKIWNIDLNYFEQLLLYTFCPQIIYIFSYPMGITEISEKNSLTPSKLSAPKYFWWVIFIGVLSHINKKNENQRGYTFIFLSFLILSFFWNTLYFFVFCRNSKIINLKLLTLKLSEP